MRIFLSALFLVHLGCIPLVISTPTKTPTRQLATIYRVGPDSMNGICFQPTGIDTTEDVQCRTAVFGIEGDEFPETSLSLTGAVQNRVLKIRGLSSQLAFGMSNNWEFIVDRTSVFTLVNPITKRRDRLLIQFPTIPTIDMSVGDILEFDVSQRDLTGRFFSSTNEEHILYNVIAVVPPSVNAHIVNFGNVVTAVSTISTAVLPFVPSIQELQIMMMLMSSPTCGFPYVRSLSSSLMRCVYPTLNAHGVSAKTRLLHNFVIGIIIAAAQSFLVALVIVWYRCNVPTAAAMTFAPSILMGALLVLQPGLMYGAVSTIVHSEGAGDVGIGLIGIVYALLIAVCTPTLCAIFFRHVMTRGLESSVTDFPVMISFLMPAVSWGPRPRINSLQVPCAMMRGQKKVIYSAFPYLSGSLFGFILALEPSSALGCSIMALFCCIALLVVAVSVIKINMYRSRSQACILVVALLFLLMPGLVYVLQGANSTFTGLAESPLTVMIVLMLVLTALRACCTIIAFVLEITVLAKRVWPVGEVFPQLDFHVVDDTSKWSILTKAADKVMGGVIGPTEEGDEELNVENLHASFGSGDFGTSPSGSFNRRPGGLSSPISSASGSEHSPHGRRKKDDGEGSGQLLVVPPTLPAHEDDDAVPISLPGGMKILPLEPVGRAHKPPNVMPARVIRRSTILAHREAAAEDVQRLHAQLEGQADSVDMQRAIEYEGSRNTMWGSFGSGDDTTTNTARKAANNNNSSLARSRATSVFTTEADSKKPRLGTPPKIKRRMRSLALAGEKQEEGGHSGGGDTTGLRFEMGSKNHPFAQLVLGRGPMPPHIAKMRREEYELL